MHNDKRSDAIDPRNIPQVPNQETPSKQEGTFRNVQEEGSRGAHGNDHKAEQEDKTTKEEAAAGPEKDNQTGTKS